MSQVSLSLHRTVSARTIPQRDGHHDGHLNIIATRHGWTRHLSISPEDVAVLDYAVLEAVLELNTLRLRPQHLRIYVESPPHSGQYNKIRYWKDDGSLQSILVKQFFHMRMEEGTNCTFDIRDGTERDDTISIKSGISGSRFLPGGLSRPGETKSWLKQRKGAQSPSIRSGLPVQDDEDTETPLPVETKPSRTQALWYFLGLTDQPPAPPPKTEGQIVAEAQHEEDTLKKHGWMPPVVRRITSRRSQKSVKSGSTKNRIVASNPFFSSSERNLVRRRANKGSTSPAPEGENAADSEELQMVVPEEVEAASSTPKPVQKETRWLRMFSSKKDDESQEGNPFLGAKEKKGKGKDKDKPTVTIVSKPTDAFEHSPNSDD